MMSLQYKFTEKKPIDETYHRPHMIIVEHGVALDAIARWLVADPAPLADGLVNNAKFFSPHLCHTPGLHLSL